MPKEKFYVVWKGFQPGIYRTWSECEQQINGFEGALFKSFPTLEEAETAYKQDPRLFIGNTEIIKPDKSQVKTNKEIIWESVSVDAAWNTQTKIMEYRGVYTKNGKELFRCGPYHCATNNVGEFLALVHALAFLKQKNSTIPVYSDSATAIAWVKKKHAKTTLVKNAQNEKLFNLIERAEKWLFENIYPNQILKWETELWGEIPADFGRK